MGSLIIQATGASLLLLPGAAASAHRANSPGRLTELGTWNSKTCPGSEPSGIVIATSFPDGESHVSCWLGFIPSGIVHCMRTVWSLPPTAPGVTLSLIHI